MKSSQTELGADSLWQAAAHREPLQPLRDRVDPETLALVCAGVYSSFLRHAEAAARNYGLKTEDIRVELGRRRMVGGQEDMNVDIALDLPNDRYLEKSALVGSAALASS